MQIAPFQTVASILDRSAVPLCLKCAIFFAKSVTITVPAEFNILTTNVFTVLMVIDDKFSNAFPFFQSKVAPHTLHNLVFFAISTQPKGLLVSVNLLINSENKVLSFSKTSGSSSNRFSIHSCASFEENAPSPGDCEQAILDSYLTLGMKSICQLFRNSQESV